MAGLPAGAAAQVSGECAVVAGRDVSVRDIILKCGLTNEEVLALVQKIHERDSPAVQEVAKLSRELGITQSAVQTFFLILGQKNVPPERLLETLAGIAQDHVTAVKRLEAVRSDDPDVNALRNQAAEAIKHGT